MTNPIHPAAAVIAVVFLLRAFPAGAHPLNTSSSQIEVRENDIQLAFKFHLDDYARVCGLDADGSKSLERKELEGAIGRLYDCMEPHVGLSLDAKPAKLERMQQTLTAAQLKELLPDGSLDISPNNRGPVYLQLRYRAAFERHPKALGLAVRFHEFLGEEHGHIAYVKTAIAIQPAVFSARNARHDFDLDAVEAAQLPSFDGGSKPAKPRRSNGKSLWDRLRGWVSPGR
ncbi:MAG: hypothetical protein ABIJ96_06740 [Elusimicrobiota bacterium]